MTILVSDRRLIEIETGPGARGVEVQLETGIETGGIGTVSRTETGTTEIEEGMVADKILIVVRSGNVRDKVRIHFLVAFSEVAADDPIWLNTTRTFKVDISSISSVCLGGCNS